MVKIAFDREKCTGCMLCVELCPNEVLEFKKNIGKGSILVARADACCACMTCAGKCPRKAISISQDVPHKRYVDDGNETPFVPLSEDSIVKYAQFSEELERALKLRWKPVAVTLIQKKDPLPHVPVPGVRLRYCQSLIMARRGLSILMPPQSHACPDGTSILGLSKIPHKLATGEIYVQLGKLATREAAANMVKERPSLPQESVRATLVTPLETVVMKPDVVVVIAPPESMMWLCMSLTYFTGKRMNFQMSSYNAQCVETTLYPYTTGEMNMSLGCYGCRAISDLGEDMMFMGIPIDKMPIVMEGLAYLGRKAIPDARSKVYLPPLI